MTTTDTDFFRAFAGRVRTQLATTRSASPEGSPDVNTIAETTGAPAPAIPATFLAAPDLFRSTAAGQCTVQPWCVETEAGHADHIGKPVAFYSADDAPPILEAYLYTDTDGTPDLTWNPGYDADDYTSGEQLREQTARVRAHLARLDAFADEYDAMREAAGGTAPEPAALPEQSGDLRPWDDTANQLRTPGGADPLFSAYLFTPTEHETGIGDNAARMVVVPGETRDAELNAAGARKFRADLAAFLPRLDAMISTLDKGATAAPVPPARTWTITTEHGVKVSGHLPPWTTGDPSEDGIPANRLQNDLADVTHIRYFGGQTVNADLPAESGRYFGPVEILNGGIWCQPYSDDPAERVPVVNVELIEGSDDWIHGLDPDGVVDLAAKLRAQADRLDFEVRPMLVAAREDWAANGGNA